MVLQMATWAAGGPLWLAAQPLVAPGLRATSHSRGHAGSCTATTWQAGWGSPGLPVSAGPPAWGLTWAPRPRSHRRSGSGSSTPHHGRHGTWPRMPHSSHGCPPGCTCSSSTCRGLCRYKQILHKAATLGQVATHTFVGHNPCLCAKLLLLWQADHLLLRLLSTRQAHINSTSPQERAATGSLTSAAAQSSPRCG